MAARLFILVSSLVAAAAQLQVRPVTRPGVHSEGPVWDCTNKGLLFVDIAAQSLNFYEPQSGFVRSIEFDGPVSPVLALPRGLLAVGVGHELRLLNWAGSNFSAVLRGRPQVLGTVDNDKPGNRFNDGRADSKGRIWIGTMGPEPTVGNVVPNQGSLFRITQLISRGRLRADVESVVSPVSISNGLVFNHDETLMYYIDTPTRRVDVFDYNLEAGTVSNRRPAFDFAASHVEGNPDGMAIDSQGHLWVACFGGGQVIEVDPREQRLLRRIAIPASQVTSAAFGAPGEPATGDTLYVTSMRKGLSEEELAKQPLAGSVFAVTGLGAHGRWTQQGCP